MQAFTRTGLVNPIEGTFIVYMGQVVIYVFPNQCERNAELLLNYCVCLLTIKRAPIEQ